MSIRTIIAITVALLVTSVAAAYFVIGPERVWTAFGPPDLGDVTFEQLQRRTTPNDALACPPGVCAAASDVTPPVYAVSVKQLRAAFARVIASEHRVVLTAADDLVPSERYIQRSKLMRYPDTIVVRYFGLPGGRSAIALYSRSQLGRSDFGVNRTRIERWLGKLSKEAPAQPGE
jgi:uncharacterized protein (DUF1499 family)